jgi:LysR family hydrogen peroxide-inducible transcriptional activator
MTLTELRYIVALARERHFGRAAKACFVSQPTLSVAVRKLEDEIEITLFERKAGEVILTPIGARVVEQARRVLEAAALIKPIAQQGRDELIGELKLGAIYTVGPYLLPHMIPKLRRRAPDMPLMIEENYTAELNERLRRGALDVIIISLPFAEPNVSTWPLYREPFSILLPLGHRLAEKHAIHPHDLEDENLLMLGAGHCFRDQVLEVCPECNPANNTAGTSAVEGSSLETIRQMVVSGLGITVLPCTSIRTNTGQRGAKRLVVEKPFAGENPTRTIALAWRESFPRPRAIEALHCAIIECRLADVTYLDSGPQPYTSHQTIHDVSRHSGEGRNLDTGLRRCDE